TAPSWSARTMSFGNTATPPKPIGSPQPTKVRPATEGGAENPSHHTGRLVPSTPSTSRTTPSVTSAATPRLTMRAHRMSPNTPASVTPMASITAMQPCGMASIAVREEIGDDQDSGSAATSHAGPERTVQEVTSLRHEAQREGGPDQPRLSRLQRLGTAHPDVSQALLEQHGGDGAGGHAGQGCDSFGGPGHMQGQHPIRRAR